MGEQSTKPVSEMAALYLGTPLNRQQKSRKRRLLSQTIQPLNLAETGTLSALVDAFKGMSIQARRIGQCASVLEGMLTDKRRPTILLGLAGPLIAAGLRRVIRDMIAYGMVDVVVSTGAIFYQDIFQARGNRHYRGTPDADDAVLREYYINRIYDTYVDDEKFVDTDVWIGRFADTLEPGPCSSREFLWKLGAEIADGESIVATARVHGVPLFCPALNDSSIGIGLTEHYHRRKRANEPPVIIDSIRDNYELTQIVVKSKSTAAIYVAGGVPKNYINDSVVMAYIFGKVTGGHTYAFQLTTDVPHWGGLSGSTLDEAKSWGKVSTKATRAMAFVEPSVSLPLVAGYALQKKLWKGRRRVKLSWKGDILTELKPGARVTPSTCAR